MNSNPSSSQIRLVLGVVGAAIGGLLGYLAFLWIVRQGLYALILPGAALGLGAGIGARHNSHAAAAGYGVLALLLTIFCEWRFAPFAIDDSLPFFVTHLHELRPMKLIMIGIAGFVAYRLAIGFGPRQSEAKPSSNDG